jgi:hypothetical protein
LQKQFWGRTYGLAVSSGTITDEMVSEYIDEQEGERSPTTVDFQSTIHKPLAF